MAAGVFGYMGYDTVRLIEKLPDENEDPLDLPESLMIRPTLILIFDAIKDEVTLGHSRTRTKRNQCESCLQPSDRPPGSGYKAVGKPDLARRK